MVSQAPVVGSAVVARAWRRVIVAIAVALLLPGVRFGALPIDAVMRAGLLAVAAHAAGRVTPVATRCWWWGLAGAAVVWGAGRWLVDAGVVGLPEWARRVGPLIGTAAILLLVEALRRLAVDTAAPTVGRFDRSRRIAAGVLAVAAAAAVVDHLWVFFLWALTAAVVAFSLLAALEATWRRLDPSE